ncbi:DMT family transporter [Pseudodesulfovibrio senegalensis]|uniref:DMT family transporter n=1 Tax=Pseudodesulfovibrio senegalensis TaxID=1721087 RepID=A0A6N6N7R2_9BACT|nr:DMT family transporter [Pseudodesulfovibrio senegalensis]KAB1443435.1 DMT family transporter [Pseudodesulfovibrio senegalensis]
MIQGLAYSVISAISFGMLVIFVKLGYRLGLDAVTMLQYRFTFGVTILFLWLLFRAPDQLRAKRKTVFRCGLIGIFIYPLQSICFASAAKYIPASTTALILYFYPVAVTLLSALFFGMRIDRTVVVSLMLVLGGCTLVFYDAFLQQMNPTGIALAFGAMATFSVYLIVVQALLRDEQPLRATLYVLLFACITYNVAGGPQAYSQLTLQTMPIAFGLGLIACVFAVTFLYLAIEKVGSAYASIFSSIEPVATLAAAALLLEENVVLLQVGGAALIVAGIVLPNLQLLRAGKALGH